MKEFDESTTTSLNGTFLQTYWQLQSLLDIMQKLKCHITTNGMTSDCYRKIFL